ncbi:MAG: enoyl-CoA hydratase-related protein [Pseudomonadota bacterium]
MSQCEVNAAMYETRWRTSGRKPMTAQDISPIFIEDHGNHLVVVSDNPAQKNTLSLEYHKLLLEALGKASSEDRITSIILVGRSGYFSAGGNLGLLAKNLEEDKRDDRYAIVSELQECVQAIQTCPKPVISAVHGGAAGGGFSIALACDLIICDEDSVFMPAYVKIGAVPDGGLTSTLAKSLPHALAMEICLFGKPVTAELLHQHGLVNALVPPGTAEETASEFAAKLARGPATTHRQMKSLIVAAKSNTLADQLDLERETLVELLGSPVAKEGISAFLDKRRADFAKAEGRSDT